MTFSFNLIDQPWIPCIRLDGTRDELSLRDTLAQAHTLREIRGDTPLETASLLRLFLVVLHRVFGPKDTAAWRALWERRELGLNDKLLNDYLTQWHHKFDLFDTAKPFFQYAADIQKKKRPPKTSSMSKKAAEVDEVHLMSLVSVDTVNKMVLTLTQDTTLFEHTLSSFESGGAVFTPAQAARALLAIHGFALGYEQFTDGPCASGVSVFVIGRSLLETLILNLTRYPETEGKYASETHDKPAWEQETPFSVQSEHGVLERDFVMTDKGRVYKNHIPLGQLDYLTWQNRKLKLIPEIDHGHVVVRRMQWAPGMRLDTDITDPMQTHFKLENSGWNSIGFSPAQALWRDSYAILRIADSSDLRPIKALSWLAILARKDAELSNKPFQISALGMAKSKAKLLFLRAENMPLPMSYLSREDRDELIGKLAQCIELSESSECEIAPNLFLIAWLLLYPKTNESEYTTSKDGKSYVDSAKIFVKIKQGKNDQKNKKMSDERHALELARSWNAEERYWAALEPHFHRLITDLPNNPDKAEQAWHAELRRAAKNAFDYAEQCVSGDPRAARAIAVASPQFYGRLKSLFPKQPNTEEEESDS